MKDYRLRLGMRFVRQGREFTIEGPLPENRLRVKDTVTGVSYDETRADLLDALFAGKIELLGEEDERRVLLEILARTKVSDLTLLDETDPLKIEAIRRHHYVSEVLSARLRVRTRESLYPIIEQVAREIVDAEPPAWSTLRRWCDAYERAGRDVRALVPAIKSRGNRQPKYAGRRQASFTDDDRRKAEQVEQIVGEVIRVKYLTLERPTVASVHAAVSARIAAINQYRAEIDQLPIPHPSSIYTAVDRLDPYEVAVGRHGKRYAEEKFRVQKQGPRPGRPLERVECDDTKLDLLALDPATRLPLGRPWITTIIDVFTKMITGVYVGFHPPSYLTIMRCLLHAVRTKSYLKTSYPRIVHDWPAYGVPELLVADNATQFRSQDFELACLQIGTRVEHAPVRKPWYKASMERWFQTQNTRLLHELPGTTFSNVIDRGEYDPQKHAAISIDALMEMAHLWIVDIYHQTIHRGIRDIPHHRWVESVKEWPPNLPPSSRDLNVLLGSTAERTITPAGIEFLTLRYNCEELALLRRNPEKVEKFLLRYDPQDLSAIYVHDPFNERDITVPALDQEYTKGLSEWQHDVIRRYARRELRERVDIEALALAKEKIQRIVERERFQTGKVKSKQKIARFLDLGQKVHHGASEGKKEVTGRPAPAGVKPALSTGEAEKNGEKSPSGLPDLPDLQAQPLPLDRRGWGADYSLPTGTGDKEVIR